MLIWSAFRDSYLCTPSREKDIRDHDHTVDIAEMGTAWTVMPSHHFP